MAVGPHTRPVDTAPILTTVAAVRAFVEAKGPFTIAVWDFDGVIGDTEPAQASAYRDMLTERGIELEDDFFDDLVGRSEPEIWTKVRDRYDVQGETAALREERITRVTPALAEAVAPNWFVRPAVAALHESGTRSIVISSGNREVIDSYLDAWRLGSLFDEISASSGSSEDMPKRTRLREAIEDLPSALVVEDSADYLRLASALGAVTIGVRHRLNGDAAELADAIAPSGAEAT